MRLLHLTPELPYAPGGSGGSARQFHLLRELVRRGHEVTVVAPVAPHQQDGARRLEDAGVRLLGVRRPASRLRETLGALRRAPALVPRAATEPVTAWQVGVFWASLKPLALGELETSRPDLVSVEHDMAAAWIRDLPPDTPAAITLHNVSWSYYESRARAASGPATLGLRAEAGRYRRHDERWLPRYATRVAMSRVDADLLRFAGPVEVVPNGVATGEIGPAASEPEPDTVLFTGTMNYPPNGEAILWFAEHVWPLIARERPTARLLIVGREPTAPVRALAGPQVEVTGGVETIAPFYDRAQVVIAPLRSGGGTRLKVLEALSSARPLVSTTVGAEGIEVEDGRHLLIADGPEDFARAVLDLLADRDRGHALGRAGRALAVERYDWRALGERLEAVYERAGLGGS